MDNDGGAGRGQRPPFSPGLTNATAWRWRAPPLTLLPLIAAKVSRPQMPRARIHRQRLIDKIDAAAQGPVTLICAGAGWGKTLLASSWVATRRMPTGWLTLDNLDNDPQVFWSSVVAALRADGAVPPDNPLVELPALPDDENERIRQLGNGFNLLGAPVVLVLDDFQEIDDPQVIRELTAVLRHPPWGLHLILISRSEPPLPLHRLRAGGELAEIRAADLAFTIEEAKELFIRHELTLASEDVAALLERTEGWPAGLQLSVSFLAGPDGPRPIADFAGDVRPVDEYLANEVLAGLPERLRRFLLCTSICDHLSGELADAVTLQADGQRTLEELERVNDFVVRLGVRPRWYRYHHLLRDALRHRLLLESPQVVPELHRRAARWYAAHHSIFEALDHTVAAEDWPSVGELVVTQAAPLILSTNRSAVMRLLARVPPRELSSTAELMVCAAALVFHAGDFDALPSRLAGARALLPDRPDADRLPVEIALRALQMSAYRAVGDMPALVTEATEVLARVAKVRFAPVPSALQYRAIALNNKGVGLLWTGRPDLAERYLWAAFSAAQSVGLESVEINAAGHLAVLEVMRGSVEEAARLAGDARELAERRDWAHSVAAHLAMVLVCIERNELAGAQRALQQGLRACRNEPEAAQRPAWLGARAQLALAQGDVAGATALLQEARQQQDARMRVPALDRWLLLAESATDLMSGRPERVEARYAELEREDEPTFSEQVCRARAAFAMHDLQRAESLLPGTPAPMSETVATVEARILSALIADARGHGMQAVDALAGAFAVAEPGAIRRPFIAMSGDRLERLVGRQNLLTHRNAAFAADVLKAMTAARGAHPSRPAKSLSEREAEVLHYLPTMLTAGEIAGELGVSINTVKAHMRAIYRKLDTAKRREAVARAQDYGLL